MATPTIAYLDENGRPFLRNSIAAFVDVLGFSQTVVSAEEIGQSQKCLDSIVAALNDARSSTRLSMIHDELSDSRRWAIKFFSDNLLVGYPCDTSVEIFTAANFVIRCIQHYQLHMALNGFFVRGALTLGPLCVTDEIIFGTALIESYRLESKASIVPRVVVTEPIVRAMHAASAITQCPISSEENNQMCRDIDNLWFVNYLQAAVQPSGVAWGVIEKHKSAVLASLAQLKHHEILPKFGWVSRYHNVFCHWHRHTSGYSDELRIKRVDEESAIQRWNDLAPSFTQAKP